MTRGPGGACRRLAPIALAVVLVLAPHGAGAQDASAPGAAPGAALVAPDSIVPFERPNGALLRPGTFVYQLTLRRPTQETSLGVRTVQVTDAASGGVPGWLIAESRTGSAVRTSDSLWVTRTELTPERWVASVDRTLLGVSFTRDSAFGAVQSYRGRTSFSAAVPPGALITGGMVERVIELLPLREGYRAGASLLLLDQGTPRAIEAEIVVDRVERTRVGAADADCWVVALRAGVLEQRLWVTREAPRVVRTEQATLGGVLVAVLVP